MTEDLTNEISEENIEISLNQNELFEINKKYKKIKKYMRSSIFAVKTMDGTEKYVSEMIKEVQENNFDTDSIVFNMIKSENG